MDNMRDIYSFLVYNSFEKRRLPDPERLRLYDAIFAYGLRQEKPDFSDSYILESIWDLIEPLMDANRQRFINKDSQEALQYKRVRWEKRKIEDFLCTNLDAVSSKAKKAFIKRFIEGKEPFYVDGVKNKILELQYSDFLRTPYWKSIAQYIKERDGQRCAMCGSVQSLQVHHLSYDNHGDELHHLEDLICVCSDCHNKLHDK